MIATQQVVHSDPEIVSGTPVFVGTRVPVRSLIDDLAAGDSLDVFLDPFPSVSGEQAVAALEIAQEALLPAAYANARPGSMSRWPATLGSCSRGTTFAPYGRCGGTAPEMANSCVGQRRRGSPRS